MDNIIIGNRIGKTKIKLGNGLPTKINLIVGANSNNKKTIDIEQKKIDLGVKIGVDTITDLSMIRLDPPLWKYAKDKYPFIGVGINPPYLPFVENNCIISPQLLFKEIENFVKSGGDFMTINFFPKTLSDLKRFIIGRKIPITSRQGGLLAKYMSENKVDNPYYKILNELLHILIEYKITVNLGATFRPAGIVEAYDTAHSWEIKQQMQFYKFLDDLNIQSIVEIMSHQPLHQIGSGIQKIRNKYGSYVPFQFLGPIVTDIGSGEYDYISSAIGAAEAARYNVGKVTIIPAYEHSNFPSLKDIKIGIIATKIAVHAGDLTRLPNLINDDKTILELRSKKKSCNPNSDDSGCNKCGQFCPLKLMNLNN